jgi:hypothetical protein
MAEVGVVLVDYDNVKTTEEKTAGDVLTNLAELIPAVVSEAERALVEPRELLIRVYGGWINELGHQSRRAQWLLTTLSWHRGRRGRMIVKPALVTSLACCASDILLGTIRETGTGTRQKMVDTMLCIDALYYTQGCGLPVLVVSDDDDLVPAALASRALSSGARFHWMRRRQINSGLNDRLLRRAGVTFACIL